MIDFIPNEDYTKTYLTKGTDSNRGNKVAVVRIPKEVVAFVNIGKYHATETVKHMPLVRTGFHVFVNFEGFQGYLRLIVQCSLSLALIKFSIHNF